MKPGKIKMFVDCGSSMCSTETMVPAIGSIPIRERRTPSGKTVRPVMYKGSIENLAESAKRLLVEIEVKAGSPSEQLDLFSHGLN